MVKPIIILTVHLNPEEDPHVYKNPTNAYEKGSFYCVLMKNKVYQYPIINIWRITIEYGE
jgi:hypothetical protein